MTRKFTKYPSNYVQAATGSNMTRGELVNLIVEKLSQDYPKRYTTEDIMDYLKSQGINARYGEVSDALATAKSWMNAEY